MRRNRQIGSSFKSFPLELNKKKNHNEGWLIHASFPQATTFHSCIAFSLFKSFASQIDSNHDAINIHIHLRISNINENIYRERLADHLLIAPKDTFVNKLKQGWSIGSHFKTKSSSSRRSFLPAYRTRNTSGLGHILRPCHVPPWLLNFFSTI